MCTGHNTKGVPVDKGGRGKREKTRTRPLKNPKTVWRRKQRAVARLPEEVKAMIAMRRNPLSQLNKSKRAAG